MASCRWNLARQVGAWQLGDMAGDRQDQALQVLRQTGVGRQFGEQSRPGPAHRFPVALDQCAQKFVAPTEVVGHGGVIGLPGVFGDPAVGHRIDAVGREQFLGRVQ